ncbi:pilus assembly protein TadG-related protein [Azohydromonas caseinilytica]|uniref:Putative Flp pilus-assembly TadG-like N-terminal domain-containing protein n=1 Tax=Azohydromonas caseinilytica TaxID=2728836 RepID=A0A848F7G2_9BURK|nr:pilus assembly protein TadG-related protein [Azohydromonas caseinilytica]NML15302.1 hypothetical protein [Azohydromonas caseinilytica]
MARRRLASPQRRAQQGAVAVMFALSLVVLMGFAGLALDGGRLYVNKAELQNAADACALAAAQVLPPNGVIPAATFELARNAGRTVAMRNSFDLQSSSVSSDDVTVEFATAPVDAAWTGNAAEASANDARIARCTVAPASLALWIMPVLRITSARVSARAAATLAIFTPNCAPGPARCTVMASLVQ